MVSLQFREIQIEEKELLQIVRNHFITMNNSNKPKTEDFEQEVNRFLMALDSIIMFY